MDAAKQICDSQGGYGFLIAGGVAATYAAKLWLDIGFDAVVVGYGEYPLLNICNIIHDDRANIKNKLAAMDGVAYYDDGKYTFNPAAKLTGELFKKLTFDNMLEFSIPYEMYWEYNKQFLESFGKKNFYSALKTANLYTSSHCPNRCGYCNGKFLDEAQQSTARLYALNADELFTLVKFIVAKHDPALIYFSDDDFLFSKIRASAFAQKVITAKQLDELPQSLDFGCQSRVVNLLRKQEPDLNFIRLLAEAGFKPITVGAESCVPRLLQTPIMNKGGYAKEHVYALAQALLNHKICAGVNFMVMLPDSSKEEAIFDLHCAYELLLMGVEIRVTVRVFSQFGAPALQMDEYSIQGKKYVSPLNQFCFELPQYFKPKDRELENIFCDYVALLPTVEDFLNKKYSLQERKRNSFYAISRCLALAKALSDDTLIENFNHAAEIWFSDAE